MAPGYDQAASKAVDADHCPSDVDEIAEAYCLGILSAEDARIFEDHYITCAECAYAVQKIELYLAAMRDAARHLRAGKTVRAAGS